MGASDPYKGRVSSGGGVQLNLHAVIASSRVNGPGARLVVFFQGCIRGCHGCFNPETHPIAERLLYTAEEVFDRHLRDGIEGITVSGGEPFLQPEGLGGLLERARGYGLTAVVYTGFTHAEIVRNRRLRAALRHIDVLVDGPYVEGNRETTLLARGSTNQRFHFLSDAYKIEDFYLPGKVEVSIGPDGSVTTTGFSSLPFALAGR